jgi:hypothetical protein
MPADAAAARPGFALFIAAVVVICWVLESSDDHPDL